MAYQKFIKRGEKIYGPYTYKSRRDGDRVVTDYVGKPEKKERSSITIIGVIALLALIGFFIFQFFYPTGRVVLESQDITVSDGSIVGQVNLLLKEGELLPTDSIVKVTLNNQQRELALSSLLSQSTTTGNFFVEDTDVSGDGEGYGVLGSKLIYPNVYFRLKIETFEESKEPIYTTTESSSEPSGEPSESSEEPTESGEELAAEPVPEESSEPSEESIETKKPEIVITGQSVSTSFIDGSVTALDDFTYNLEDNQQASLVPGTIRNDTDYLTDDTINLATEGNQLVVSTGYYSEEFGFGQEYLTDDTIELGVNISEFGISAEDGTLEIFVIYQDIVISESQKAIQLTAPEEPAPEEPPVEPELPVEEPVPPVEPELPVEQPEISVLEQTETFEDIIFTENTNYTIDASEYFNNSESYSAMEMENILALVDGNLITFVPEENFTGIRITAITAYSGNSSLEGNEFSVNVIVKGEELGILGVPEGDAFVLGMASGIYHCTSSSCSLLDSTVFQQESLTPTVTGIVFVLDNSNNMWRCTASSCSELSTNIFYPDSLVADSNGGVFAIESASQNMWHCTSSSCSEISTVTYNTNLTADTNGGVFALHYSSRNMSHCTSSSCTSISPVAYNYDSLVADTNGGVFALHYSSANISHCTSTSCASISKQGHLSESMTADTNNGLFALHYLSYNMTHCTTSACASISKEGYQASSMTASSDGGVFALNVLSNNMSYCTSSSCKSISKEGYLSSSSIVADTNGGVFALNYFSYNISHCNSTTCKSISTTVFKPDSLSADTNEGVFVLDNSGLDIYHCTTSVCTLRGSDTFLNITADSLGGAYAVDNGADMWHCTSSSCSEISAGSYSISKPTTFYFTSQDMQSPTVNLVSPSNGAKNISTSITFNCSATDDAGLYNITLFTNTTGTWKINQTKSLTGTSNSTTFTINNLHLGTYKWNCKVYDDVGRSDWGDSNFTFSIMDYVETSECGTLNQANTTYRLNQSIVSTGTCFNIAANNTMLDCQGHSIIGDSSGYGIDNSGYDNVTIKNCRIINFSYGILWNNADDGRLLNNTISNNSNNGIDFYSSRNNNITSNTISSNEDSGLYFESNPNTNNIMSNTISNNNYGAYLSNSDWTFIINNTVSNNNLYGIYLFESTDNRITHNTVSNNNVSGILFVNSKVNHIINNTVSNNNQNGIHLANSNSTIIVSNTISNNSEHGIYLVAASKSNSIYNNFFNNTINANDTGINYWNVTLNCTIPSYINIIGGNCEGGNFWSDYAGADLNADGIGDTLLPYNGTASIDIGGDYLPLVYPAAGEGLQCGDTITTSTTLTENLKNSTAGEICPASGLTIGANDITLNCQGFNITGDDSGTSDYGINNTRGYDNITIKNCYIQDFAGSGIYFYHASEISENNTIINTTLFSNRYGIHTQKVMNSTIENCIFDEQTEIAAVRLEYSDDNIIANNTFNNKTLHIYRGSDRNIIEDNDFYSYHEAIKIDCWTGASTCYNNTIKSNYITSVSALGLVTTYSDGAEVYNNNINKTGTDINDYGIWFSSLSTNGRIYNNNITDAGDNGIYISSSSVYNIVENNTITNSKENGIEIQGNADNNNVTGNNISNNGDVTNKYGIYIWSTADNNTIWNNYFNNINNAKDDVGTNYWNVTRNCAGEENIIGGACIGGNYWSDYAGVDDGSDGIGDTLIPYNNSGNITGGGGDWLPLVYSAAGEGAELISTWDETDTQIRFVGDNVTFFASYTNNSAFLDGAICNISFFDGVWQMSEDPFVWAYNWSSDGTYQDDAKGVTTDSLDNVIVAGYGANLTGTNSFDWLITKFDSRGNLIWQINWTSNNATNTDEATGVAVDSQDNIIVVGWGGNLTGQGNSDFRTAKYSPSGDLIWDANWSGNGSMTDWPYGVAVDNEDSVIVVGWGNNLTGGGSNSADWNTIKYNSSGSLIWQRNWTSNAIDNDYAESVATDSQNNVIVVGEANNLLAVNSLYDWHIIKYNSTGSVLWEKNWSSQGSRTDYAYGVAVDNQDNVIVAGMGFNLTGANSVDWHVLKYNNDGNLLLEINWSGDNGGYDVAYSVATDLNDNIIIGGFAENMTNSASASDWLVRKYNNSGSFIRSYNWSGPAGQRDYIYSVSTDSQNRIIAAGRGTNLTEANSGYDWHLGSFQSAYNYIRTFDAPGIYEWNVTCIAPGFTAQIGFDNATITETNITCGSVITQDTTLTENLKNSTGGEICPDDGLIINASNIVLNCAGFSITGSSIGADKDTGINISGFSNTTLFNCNIRKFTFGVYAEKANFTNITRGNYSDNGPEYNGADVNPGYNIYFKGSYNFSINDIEISNPKESLSSGDTAYGIYITDSDNGVVRNVIGIGGESGNGDMHAYGIRMQNSNNNQIINCNLSDWQYLVYLASSSNNTIYNNAFENNLVGNDESSYGIYISSGLNNNITSNLICNNTGGASSGGGSGGSSYGIYLSNSNFSIVQDNNLSNNFGGIGDGNAGGAVYGIYISSGFNNNITSNLIYNNTGGEGAEIGVDYGIFIVSSNNNTIYNNFFNNTNNVNDNGNNTWNTTLAAGTNIIGGSFIGGNYWNDYAGADDGSGGRVAGDGIGDTNLPYNGTTSITHDGDWLPLVYPSAGAVSGNITLNSPIDNFVTDSNMIIFNCSFGNMTDLTSVSLYTDVWGSWQQNIIKSASGSNVTVLFVMDRIPPGTYSWTCAASNGGTIFANENRTFIVNQTTLAMVTKSNATGNYYRIWNNGTWNNEVKTTAALNELQAHWARKGGHASYITSNPFRYYEGLGGRCYWNNTNWTCTNQNKASSLYAFNIWGYGISSGNYLFNGSNWTSPFSGDTFPDFIVGMDSYSERVAILYLREEFTDIPSLDLHLKVWNGYDFSVYPILDYERTIAYTPYASGGFGDVIYEPSGRLLIVYPKDNGNVSMFVLNSGVTPNRLAIGKTTHIPVGSLQERYNDSWIPKNIVSKVKLVNNNSNVIVGSYANEFYAEVWDGTDWIQLIQLDSNTKMDNGTHIESYPDSNYNYFDSAFSGEKALIVWVNNVTGENTVKYRFWDGTFGSEQTLSLSEKPKFVQVDGNANGNEFILTVVLNSSNVKLFVYNGTWDSGTDFGKTYYQRYQYQYKYYDDAYANVPINFFDGLDTNLNPIIKLTSPDFGTIYNKSSLGNINFNCEVWDDVGIENITLYSDVNSGNWEELYTISVNGSKYYNLSYAFDATGKPIGLYEWNCQAFDIGMVESKNPVNKTFTISEPIFNLSDCYQGENYGGSVGLPNESYALIGVEADVAWHDNSPDWVHACKLLGTSVNISQGEQSYTYYGGQNPQSDHVLVGVDDVDYVVRMFGPIPYPGWASEWTQSATLTSGIINFRNCYKSEKNYGYTSNFAEVQPYFALIGSDIGGANLVIPRRTEWAHVCEIALYDLISVSLDTPDDGTMTMDENINFSCSAASSTTNLTNISLYIWELGSEPYATYTLPSGQRFASASWIVSGLERGTYHWNCEARNSNNSNGWAPYDYELTKDCVDPYDEMYITSDTLFCNGTYYINDGKGDGIIRVDNMESIDIRGMSPGTIIIGNGTGRGFNVSYSNDILIHGITLKNYYAGIYEFSSYLNNFSNNVFINCSRTNPYYGVYSYRSNSTLVSDNIMQNSSGVYLWYSNGAIVVNNNVTYGEILLDHSDNSTISNNVINSTGLTGIGLSTSSDSNRLEMNMLGNTNTGISLSSSDNNEIINNTIINCSGQTTAGIDVSTGSNYNLISNNTIIYSRNNGIYIDGSGYNYIIGNTIFNLTGSNGQGIILYNSGGNLISSNNITKNYYGIILDGSSSTIVENNIIDNNRGYGIDMDSSNNNITFNNITNNNDYGIFIRQYRNRNNISNNNIKNSKKYDIYFELSNYNCSNTIYDNTGTGDKPIEFYNTQASIQNTELSELIFCGANNSVANNINIGESSIRNNGVLVLGTSHSELININSSYNYYGFFVNRGENNTITGSTANNNNYTGIYLFSSPLGFGHYGAARIQNNTANDNDVWGIEVLSIENGVITENTAKRNIYGIYFGDINYSIISNNTAYNNTNGFRFSGDIIGNIIINNTAYNNSEDGFRTSLSTGDKVLHNIFQDNKALRNMEYGIYFATNGGFNNTISGCTAYENEGVSQIQIITFNKSYCINNNVSNTSGEGIYLTNIQNNFVVSGNRAENTSSAGIMIIGAWNSGYNLTISNNVIKNSLNGLYLENIKNSTIYNNEASENRNKGIYLFGTYCQFNNITNNVLHDNGNLETEYDAGLGINGDFNNITDNKIYNNTGHGLFLINGDDSFMHNNTITNNSLYGLYLYSSSRNNVTSNVITDNVQYGIYVVGEWQMDYEPSDNNTIHNNYFNNTNNVYDSDYNNWNVTLNCTLGANIIGGNCTGGNYWSDYNGTDTDYDGIGNTNLPWKGSSSIANDGDWLPLVYPTEIVPINVTLVSPSNGITFKSHNSINHTQELICNATSMIGLSNITLYTSVNGGTWQAISTKNVSGYSNFSLFNFTTGTFDNVTWNCLAYNNQSAGLFALGNYTYYVIAPIVNISDCYAANANYGYSDSTPDENYVLIGFDTHGHNPDWARTCRLNYGYKVNLSNCEKKNLNYGYTDTDPVRLTWAVIGADVHDDDVGWIHTCEIIGLMRNPNNCSKAGVNYGYIDGGRNIFDELRPDWIAIGIETHGRNVEWLHSCEFMTRTFAVWQVSPEDEIYTSNTTITFECEALDATGLLNVTLYTNISGLWQANDTKTISGTSDSATWTMSNIPGGIYSWNCLAYNTQNESVWADSNFTLNIDQIPPLISFESPTSSSGTNSTNNFTLVNVSVTENNLDEIKLNWNNINYTMYDESLVLMYNFDNVSVLGENDTYVKDLSLYDNDGNAGNGAKYTSSGKYNGAFDFRNLRNATLNTEYDDSIDLLNETTISMWVNMSTLTNYPETDISDPNYPSAYYYFPQLQVVDDKVYYAWINRSGTNSQIWTAEINTDGTEWNATARTSTSFAKQYLEMQVTEDTVYVSWTQYNGTWNHIWLGTMNPDGTEWNATQITTTGRTKAYPKFQVVDDKIYFAWMEYNGTRNQLWTASMYLNGSGYSAINLTETNRDKYYIQFQVVDDKIYYVWQQPSPSYNYLMTAESNLNGSSFNMTNRTVCDLCDFGEGDVSVPQLQVAGDSIYYVWLESLNEYEPGSTPNIWTARVYRNGSGWDIKQLTFAESAIVNAYYQYPQLQVVGDTIHYMWTYTDRPMAMERFWSMGGTAVYAYNLDTFRYTCASSWTSPADSEEVSIAPQFQRVGSRSYFIWPVSSNTKLYADECGSNIISRGDSYGIGRTTYSIMSAFVDAGLDNMKYNADASNETSGAVAESSSLSGMLSKWVHITMTYNKSNLRLYVNGMLNSSTNFSEEMIPNPYGLTIGDEANSKIDDMKIWNRALSNDEIKQQYLSNLKKYDVDEWELFVNESDLSCARYYYSASAMDSADNENQTELRTFDSDTCGPYFVNPLNTSDLFMRYHNFTANITIRNREIDTYVFLTDAQGSWQGITRDIFGEEYNASETINITAPGRSTVCWRYWANDTTGNENQSSDYCFVTGNYVPADPTVVLNSTYGTNYTTENLTCWANTTDANNENLTYYGNWYKNGEKRVFSWNATIGGANSDVAYAITTDSSGNIIVTGYTQSFGAGGQDVWTVKYSPSGSQLWNKTFGTSNTEQGSGIAVDSQDNVIVVGRNFIGNNNVSVIKYDSSGNMIWNATFGGTSVDYGDSIVVDNSDNIIVTGTGTFASGYDVWTIKLNSSGSMIWNASIGGSGTDEGKGIAIDSQGDIIVGGHTTSFGAGNYDFWAIKYDSDGTYLWNKTFGGNLRDQDPDISVDSQDNIILGGQTESFGSGNWDFWTVKLNSSGSMIWNTTIGGNSTGIDYGRDIAVDSSDNIFITGLSNSFGAGNYDMWLVKYDSSGLQLWNMTFGGLQADAGLGVFVNNADIILLTGYTASSGAGSNDFWTIVNPLNQPEFISESYLPGQLAIADILDSSQTTQGDIWSCEVAAYDEGDFSNYIMSVNMTIRVLDITPPEFTNLANQTTPYNESFAYDIDATDLNGVSCFTVNDTDFIINCSGYLENATVLSVVRYWLNISVNDTSNNVNYGLIYIDSINITAGEALNITIISPQDISYSISRLPFTITTTTTADTCWYNLDDTGSIILGKVNSTLFDELVSVIVGSHFVNFTCNDTSNNLASAATNFRVSEPGCSPRWNCTATGGWSNCTDGKQNRTCIDENGCNRGIGMPSGCVLMPDDSNTCVEERECIENCTEVARTYYSWSACINGTQTRIVNHSYLCLGDVVYTNVSEEYFDCSCNIDIDVYWPLIQDLSVPYNSTITFHVEASDNSILEGIVNLSARWYVNDILEKVDSTIGDNIESEFTRIFGTETYNVRIEISNNCSSEELEWQVETVFSNCTEDWQCEWSDCSSHYYKYPRNCRDVNDCTTNLYYPSPRKCYCAVLPNCTDWEECEADYNYEDVLKGNYVFQGMQKRYCNDSNLCLKHQFEEWRLCNLTVPVEIKKVEKCHGEYVEVYEAKENKLVAIIKEQELANLTKVFVMFTPTSFEGYCSYCYDGIKDYDEEDVDCGGPNCPSCLPSHRDLFWLWKLVTEVLVLSAIIYLAFSLEPVKRALKKTIKRMRKARRHK